MIETQDIQLLVVDDDPALRELLERYLKEQNYAVASVEDGLSMDAYLAEHDVDLIILDIMLPGEDGLSIARRLQVEKAAIPRLRFAAQDEGALFARIALLIFVRCLSEQQRCDPA